MITKENHSNWNVVNEAGGVSAAGRSRSTFDLGVETLLNQGLDESLLLEQGQLLW